MARDGPQRHKKVTLGFAVMKLRDSSDVSYSAKVGHCSIFRRVRKIAKSID